MSALTQSTTLFVNSLLFIIYSFALPHHLRTFFSPFKRVAEKSTSPGINLREIAEVWSYNLVSIGIGMILRLFVIFAGLAILLLTLPITLILTIILPPIWPLLQKKSPALPILDEIKNKTALGKFLREKLVLPENVDIQSWLTQNLLDETDLKRIVLWYQNLHAASPFNLLDRDSVTKIAGFGADWSYGYTNELNKFQVPQGTSPYPQVVGRDQEILAIEKILSKSSQNSVIVAGEPGVGRHAVVDELARRLFSGNVTPSLVGHRTIYLDLKSAISGQTNLTDNRKIALDLFEEGRQAGNIILIIDDIDKFLETSGERLDLSDILNQTLADGKLRVIGITSSQMTDKYVTQNSSLLKLFSVVKVSPPDLETVYQEMEISIAPTLEKEHKIKVSYPAIKAAVSDADRFISTVPFPEKAVNILDEAISTLKTDHPHAIELRAADVDRFLSAKTQIPVGNLDTDQKDKLANLESDLHQRIIGQDEAVSALSKALRRAVLEISARNKPIGTFLFLGPTGVGKTETAKALAEIYFGSQSRLTRFDMSEFQGEVGLERFLATLPVTLVDNPFAVVLLDEIEKAPPLITNLLLTLIDEGYITNANNQKVSAKENIIIGTSNAGALHIKQHGSEGLIDYIQNEKIFSPEFINRFDGVIVFKPLDDVQIRTITQKMLAGVAKRLTDKKITFEYSPDLLDRILKDGYDPQFGARSIRRYIQDTVEDEISKKLLSESYPPGSILKI